MDKLVIRGGSPLLGTVRVSGAEAMGIQRSGAHDHRGVRGERQRAQGGKQARAMWAGKRSGDVRREGRFCTCGMQLSLTGVCVSCD